jgi:hypothetical protein
LQIGGSGLAAARIGLHIERKLLALVEIMHAGALNRRHVNEYIGAAVVLNDKAITPLGIEEFNGTRSHQWLLLETRKGVVAPNKPFRMGIHIRILRVLGEGREGQNYKVRRNRERPLYSDAVHALQSLFGF